MVNLKSLSEILTILAIFIIFEHFKWIFEHFSAFSLIKIVAILLKSFSACGLLSFCALQTWIYITDFDTFHVVGQVFNASDRSFDPSLKEGFNLVNFGHRLFLVPKDWSLKRKLHSLLLPSKSRFATKDVTFRHLWVVFYSLDWPHTRTLLWIFLVSNEAWILI